MLAVLLFHAGYDWMPGGYVGVDVFFVISGFLITRLLVKELQAGTFSFRAFYLRRLRRLFPAFLFTLVASSVAALVLLPTDALPIFAADMRDTALGIVNFRFSGSLGYFDASSLPRVLAHMWSLAVEEQYYLGAPLGAWLCFRLGGARLVLVMGAAAFVASLVAASVIVPLDAEAAYFLTPFRVWELTLGGLLVFVPENRPHHPVLRETLAAGGLAAIVVAAVTLDANSGVPGLSALLPCLGAAAIIVARDARLSRMVLGNRVAAAIGRMSYSLYLVHWPVIAFFAIAALQPEIAPRHRLPAIALSLLIAAFMYRFVERPARRASLGATGTRLAVASAIASILVVASAGHALRRSDGLPSRLMTTIGAPEDPYGPCLEKLMCPLQDGAEINPDLIVMGDSNALHLATAMLEWSNTHHVKTVFIFGPGCYLPGGLDPKARWHDRCEEARAESSHMLTQFPKVPVVLAGQWVGYTGQLRNSDEFKSYLAGLARTHPLVLFGQVPYPPRKNDYCGQVQGFMVDEPGCRSYTIESLYADVNSMLRAYSAAVAGTVFVDPTGDQCTGNMCSGLVGKASAFSTFGHLSKQGAMVHLEGKLGRAISAMLKDGR